VVSDNILGLLSKNDLEDVSGDKYESSVTQAAREGDQAVRQELQAVSEACAELTGCDPDLPALLDQPTETDIKRFLTHQ